MKTISFIIYTLLVFFTPTIWTLVTNHPISLWLIPLIISFIGYGTYKLKFNSTSALKIYLFRNYIRFKWSVSNINKTLKAEPENHEILPIQTKSIKLWKLLLRDDESQISCSLGNRIRQIEKDNMLLILSPINQLDFQLTIMDVDNNKSCLYEIPIYSRISDNLIEVFDNENERRMNLGQSEKRQSIHNDLDKLISQQQESLKRRTKI
jgi:hypothetical protein